MDYRTEMKQLRDTLNENARLYYTLDASTMSDYEYDRLYRRLQEMEKQHPEEITPDSPTQRVGDAVLNDFAAVAHPVPLESLEDVFDSNEVKDFLAKVLDTLPQAEYSVEPKVDGLSVALEYRDGVFFQGATRRPGRGGCNGQSAHHPLYPHGAAGEAAPAHRPGRGVYGPVGF